MADNAYIPLNRITRNRITALGLVAAVAYYLLDRISGAVTDHPVVFMVFLAAAYYAFVVSAVSWVLVVLDKFHIRMSRYQTR